MTHSWFLKDESSLSNMSTGYSITPSGKLVPGKHIGYGWSGGAGSIVSTAGDLAQWDIALFSGHVITVSDVKLATSSARLPNGQSTGYGFGWRVDRINGLPIISHDGAMLGFTSINDVFPTVGVAIIILANNADAYPDAIAKNILASMDPGFAKGRDVAAPGENPQVTTQIEHVWTQLRDGTPDRSEFTATFGSSLTPPVVRFYHRYLTRRDPPSPALRWAYKGKQTGADGIIMYSYRVLFNAGFAILVSAAIAEDGKVADFNVDYD